MDNKVFKIDLNADSVVDKKKEEISKPIKNNNTVKEGYSRFSLSIPEDGYISINNLINIKLREREINYNLTSFFLEGLERLRAKNPLVKDDKPLERRYYRGGLQKQKVKSIATSVVIETRHVYWIDNYILQERLGNPFYSKPDFILDLIEELKIKYASKGENI
jgi:hypothetical protein